MVAVVVAERLLLGHLEQAQRAEQVELERQIALQVRPLLMPEAVAVAQAIPLHQELLALEVLAVVALDQIAGVWLGLLALITQAVVVGVVRIPVHLFLVQPVVKAAPVS
jgi:hypothetical protein